MFISLRLFAFAAHAPSQNTIIGGGVITLLAIAALSAFGLHGLARTA